MASLFAGDESGYVAQGSNVLRGGKHTYTRHTLESNWYEDRAEPSYEGSRPEARTEEAARQLAVTGARIPKYGAAILDAEDRARRGARYDPSNTILPDTHARAAGWKATTAASYRPVGDPADAVVVATSSTFHPKLNPMVSDSDALATYRARWLNQQDGTFRDRFRTEQTEALSKPVGDSFKVSTVRALPGVPKSLERLRERLVERFGLQTFWLVRRAFAAMDDNGDGVLNPEELRGGVADLGVRVSVDEFNELFRFLDADRSETISWTEFLSALTGSAVVVKGAAGAAATLGGTSREQTLASLCPPLPAAREAYLENVWRRLLVRVSMTSAGSLPTDVLREQVDMGSFPDVSAGLRSAKDAGTIFFEAVSKASTVSFGAFASLHQCFSALVRLDNQFATILANMWRLPVDDVTAVPTGEAPAGTCKVIVTHQRTGRRTVEEVPVGAFFSKDDHVEIKRLLSLQGIHAASVSFDF
jgi:hypothetical protein